jgi:hypothetical protein
MSSTSASNKLRDASFPKILGFWFRVGAILAGIPLILALVNCGGLKEVSGLISGLRAIGLSWLFWVAMYSICHWLFNRSLFIRFPDIPRWFWVALLLRALVAVTIVGEMAAGVFSIRLTLELERWLRLHGLQVDLEFGACSFIHGAMITGSLIVLTLIVGVVSILGGKLRVRPKGIPVTSPHAR